MALPDKTAKPSQGSHFVTPPSISLPKGGGAMRSLGEKFTANPVTGTGALRVPIATSPGRAGFGPELALSYDSGAGNGPFGFGWSLSLPAITRKTDKGLPQYRDADESDLFILSGAEDLVPVLGPDGSRFADTITVPGYIIHRYRPRIEGPFARIERWTRQADGAVHWRSISKENILTLYGLEADSRIADPAYPQRIFSWLICETRDDRGNAIVYSYKAEDGTGVDLTRAHERHRGERHDLSRTANRYLKRICYGNRTPLLEGDGNRPHFLTQAHRDMANWMFEALFDYGEHESTDPKPDDRGDWRCRRDPFSHYRAGFEVRTYRLCQRVLMFHHFAGEPGVGRDCLVGSTALDFRETPVATFLAAVTQSGYVRAQAGGYLQRSLPPLEFAYSEAAIGQTIQHLDPGSSENLPAGVDGAAYQWVDLDGEGLQGVLSEHGGGWFYKRNESPLTRDGATAAYAARFAPVEQVARLPAHAPLSEGRYQFLDLAGDGQIDLVRFDPPLSGFYERNEAYDWEPFRPFAALPNLDFKEPNLRFIDLTGDGHADILITEDEALRWYPSLAEAGFDRAVRISLPVDEERGPRILFADGTQSIFLADLSGDGLTDIVRIRNGEVCYWPNLGYGRFGAKVTMDGAPLFDAPDQFNPRRIRLADIDGSGVADLIYLGPNTARFWFNQAGNAWSEAHNLPALASVDNMTTVAVVDLFGNGTACLVWSSPLPGAATAPMRYLSLMAEGKPHLLMAIRNNQGVETRIRYAPSTYFYLRDKYDGNPWATRLPFPVHVVERVETYDYVSRNRFVTRYAYHHGHFDGAEREFRGFGLVEQWDTEEFAALSASLDFPTGENIDASSHLPPVHTKTWYHTGRYLDQRAAANMAAGLTAAEEREAWRALKGSMLRQEVYARDGSPKAELPYTVTEQRYAVRRLQARGANPHALFFTHVCEAIHYQYERNTADPRISHELTLEVDDFGNVRKSAAIGYGRSQPDLNLMEPDRIRQSQTLITYTESRFTPPIDDPARYPYSYRGPQPCETCSYELTGYSPTGAAGLFCSADFVEPAGDEVAHICDREIRYEEAPTAGRQRRLIEQVRTLYRPDDLGRSQGDPLALLPLGMIQPMALPGERYQLAFTPGLLERAFVRDGQALLSDPAAMLGSQGGYRSSQQLKAQGRFPNADPDDHWWIPSGRILFSPGGSDTAAQELAYARAHFFMPTRFRDPFHTGAVSTESVITYDAYDLLIQDRCDALGNRVTAGERLPSGAVDPAKPGNDYRVLLPQRVMDPNGNRTAVAFDALGLVVGTAAMGKPGEHQGDSLDGFVADLSETTLLAHMDDPLADPYAILGGATARLLYDLFAYWRTRHDPAPQPAAVYTLARTTHEADLELGQQTGVQHSFSYFDGFGRAIQKKAQAEPERVNGVAGPSRWVGSGWSILNNKGKPVRHYEPFFSLTHRFEFGALVGVSPILFYDPLQRVIATLHPNHTYEKVRFDPWQQVRYDVSDTGAARGTQTGDPRTDPEIQRYVARYFADLAAHSSTPWQTWHAQREGGAMGAEEQAAANKAAAHADTPTTTYFDALGRPFLTLTHNGFRPDATPMLYAARIELDIEGNQLAVRDAIEQNGDPLGRIVMQYRYDMCGHRIGQVSMEAGERWLLSDVTGNLIYAWDRRGHPRRIAYDPLRRPVRTFVAGADLAHPDHEFLVERLVYGEQHPESEQRNLRGKRYLHLDQAGAMTAETYDYKGNPLRATRRLAREYRRAIDWSAIEVAIPPDPVAQFDPAALEALLAPLTEADIFTSLTEYDALNRPVRLTTPHTPTMQPSLIRPGYNEANLLERLDVNVRGATANGQRTWAPFVTNIDYDAKGQRQRIDYGNGVSTSYDYDPLTFRLVRLLTRRSAAPFLDDCSQPPPAGWPGCQVQHLRYTYDPAGNITHIRDDAQQTIYFRNRRVEPSGAYTYDPLYRLIEATGREHLGQVGGAPIAHSHDDTPRVGLAWSANDGNALGTYIERYRYDAAGNLLEVQHRGADPAHPGWTRHYTYDETSECENGAGGAPRKRSNRLSSTSLGESDPLERYTYDAHGNMIGMPHLGSTSGAPNMWWDYRDQLCQVSLGGGGTAYYVYDASGQRVRKVWEKAPGLVEERIDLHGFEIFRRRNGAGDVTLERETLHIMDGQQRIALIESRTVETTGSDSAPPQLIRYQVSNHLGSATLELDDQARIISYEEYTPYGSTAYQAVRSQTEAPKRYRYTGKERDEESGLYYHEARYYAPWLGRWSSCDPAGLIDGFNLYRYARNNPVLLRDPSGMDPDPRQYGERSIQLHMNSNSGTGQIGYRLTIELQNPATGDRFYYSSTGDAGGLRAVHQQLLQNAGFAAALTPAEREGLFRGLESFAQSVGSVSPPRDGGGTPPHTALNAPSRESPGIVQTGLGAVGNVARGIEADRLLPQRYRLEPARGATVTGIRDTQAGRLRGNPPRPVGAPVIRVDQPHGSTNYPHINVESLTPDPHYRISPGALRAAGRIARGFETAGRIARPIAIVTDVARLGTAVYEDRGLGRNTARTAASVAGGWAGAFAGAWAGAKGGALLGGAIGSVIPGLGTAAGAAVGGFLGGIVGGISGGFLGSWAGERAADAVLE